MRIFFGHPGAALFSCVRLLPLALLGAAACAPVVVSGYGQGGSGGASSSTTSPTGNGGSPWDTTTTASSSTGGDTTTTSASGGGTACADPGNEGLPSSGCTPTSPVCGSSTSVCVATADASAAPSFGLRVAHLTMTAPKVFTQGIVKSIFDSSTAKNLAACNLNGSGMFNWLLRFDTEAGTLTTGAARPVSDPFSGYTFIDETLTLGATSFAVAPLTLSSPVDPACGLTSTAGDVRLPFFGNLSGTTLTILPLRSLRFFDTHVTPDHNCIGAFNAANLSPANGCTPDDTHPAFLDGGQLEAFITLEDADTVLVPPLDESLCLLLTGNASMYGTGGGGTKNCKRDAGNAIVFQGDWCSATNQPAAGGCADAMRFAATFAASGTKIN